MSEIKSESRFSFAEATSVIVGHGVGSGILAVPYLASRNTWWDFLWIIAVAYCINVLMHLMIAELSLNNGGAHFVSCFKNELFPGEKGKIVIWIVFALTGLSTLCNMVGYITGASAVFTSWLGLPSALSSLLYFVLAGLVVFFGMKLVGICEKYCVYAMIGVIGILLVAVLLSGTSPLPSSFIAPGNMLALYSTISFSLSAVMSVPQVVKGLDGDRKKITASIAVGSGINMGLIILVTFMTLLGAGSDITKNGALVDLSAHLGGWVSVIGYLFSLLALSTSFWTSSLNMRDIVCEQTGWRLRLGWLVSSAPCLVLALLGLSSFVGFARIAGVIQVLTGIGIILAFSKSRRKAGASPICGKFGALPFCLLVILSSIIATVGSVISVK